VVSTELLIKNKFDMENKTSMNQENGNDAKRLSAGSCFSCQFWEKLPEVTYSIDMGKCHKLSGTKKPEKNPDVEITGIESSPISIFDWPGFYFETKSWFLCIHYKVH